MSDPGLISNDCSLIGFIALRQAALQGVAATRKGAKKIPHPIEGAIRGTLGCTIADNHLSLCKTGFIRVL
jgi:hypothetical protein